jgi:hypothetical protein
MVKRPIFPLNVFQSVDCRYPFWVELATCWVIEVPEPITAPVPPVTESPAVPVWVRLPNVRADCFELKVVQSALARQPAWVPEDTLQVMFGFAPPLETIGAVAVTDVTPVTGVGCQLAFVPSVWSRYPVFPVWDGRKAFKAAFALTCPLPPFTMEMTPVTFAEFPDMFPVTCDPGNERFGRLVKVVLADEVMFAAVPVVLWFSVGTSAGVMARKAGVAAEPVVGPAQNEFAAWVTSVSVKVPDAVMGEPETEMIDAGGDRATLVTDPEPLLLNAFQSAEDR